MDLIKRYSSEILQSPQNDKAMHSIFYFIFYVAMVIQTIPVLTAFSAMTFSDIYINTEIDFIHAI